MTGYPAVSRWYVVHPVEVEQDDVTLGVGAGCVIAPRPTVVQLVTVLTGGWLQDVTGLLPLLLPLLLLLLLLLPLSFVMVEVMVEVVVTTPHCGVTAGVMVAQLEVTGYPGISRW